MRKNLLTGSRILRITHYDAVHPPEPAIDGAPCCPDDGSYPLRPASGGLACPECGRLFPLQDGILSLMPMRLPWTEEERRAVEMERSARDREARVYDRLLALRLLSLAEIPATLGPLSAGPQDRVVEVGCGTGRFTTQLVRTGAALVAVDHSLESLRVLRRKLRETEAERVQLVQAEAARLPVRSGWATRALAAQAFEHLPSNLLREQAVAELARVLQPGGRMAVSVYWHTPGLEWLLRQDGCHSGGIPYHRFSRPELARLLAPHLEIEQLTGRLVYLLLAHGRRST